MKDRNDRELVIRITAKFDHLAPPENSRESISRDMLDKYTQRKAQNLEPIIKALIYDYLEDQLGKE